jgi:hypothetical protein
MAGITVLAPLTPVQRDLVRLLYEVCAVHRESMVDQVARLVLRGDGGRLVQVDVDRYADVEWKVIGERVNG